MRTLTRAIVVAIIVCTVGAAASAAAINSATTTIGGAPLTDFEGFAEGVLPGISGVAFSQPGGGTPQVDNSPFLFGYTSSSGVGVLTGTADAIAQFPTVSGLIATFSAPQVAVEAFMSDTSPLGNYTVTAYGAGLSFLESQVVTGVSLQNGRYVGFNRPAGDIFAVQWGPGSVSNDAFSIDDLRSTAIPEPGTIVLVGLACAGLLLARRRRR